MRAIYRLRIQKIQLIFLPFQIDFNDIHIQRNKQTLYLLCCKVRIILEKREPNFNDTVDELKMKRTFDM